MEQLLDTRRRPVRTALRVTVVASLFLMFIGAAVAESDISIDQAEPEGVTVGQADTGQEIVPGSITVNTGDDSQTDVIVNVSDLFDREDVAVDEPDITVDTDDGDVVFPDDDDESGNHWIEFSVEDLESADFTIQKITVEEGIDTRGEESDDTPSYTVEAQQDDADGNFDDFTGEASQDTSTFDLERPTGDITVDNEEDIQNISAVDGFQHHLVWDDGPDMSIDLGRDDVTAFNLSVDLSDLTAVGLEADDIREYDVVLDTDVDEENISEAEYDEGTDELVFETDADENDVVTIEHLEVGIDAADADIAGEDLEYAYSIDDESVDSTIADTGSGTFDVLPVFVDECGTLSMAGTYFPDIHTSDADEACLHIAAEDIMVLGDGGGNVTVDDDAAAIAVDGGVSDVTIAAVLIESQETGVYLEDATDVWMEELTIQVTDTDGFFGVAFEDGASGNVLMDSEINGVAAEADNIVGIWFGEDDTNDDNLVAYTAVQHASIGMYLQNTGENNVVSNHFNMNQDNVLLEGELGENRFVDNTFTPVTGGGQVVPGTDWPDPQDGTELGARFAGNAWWGYAGVQEDITNWCSDVQLTGFCDDEVKVVEDDGEEKLVDLHPLSFIGMEEIDEAIAHDRSISTYTAYPRGVGIIGNDLNVTGIDVDQYTLLEQEDDEDPGYTAHGDLSGSLDTDGLEEGIFNIEHEETILSQTIELIDMAEHDAAGRIDGASTVDTSDVTVKDWYTLEEIQQADVVEEEERYGYDDEAGDILYKFDTDEAVEDNDGWVTVDADGAAVDAHPVNYLSISEEHLYLTDWERMFIDREFPVINDFMLEDPHDLDVDVVDMEGGSVDEDVGVQVQRHDDDFGDLRLPFLYKPPTPEQAVSDGSATFDVPTGAYSVRATGTENGYVQSPSNPIQPDVEVPEDAGHTLQVTDETATVTADIDGPDETDAGDDIRYAFIAAREDPRGMYLNASVGTGELSLTVPAGLEDEAEAFELVAIRFSPAEDEGMHHEVMPSMTQQIQETELDTDEGETVEFEFEVPVDVDISLEDQDGNDVMDAFVSLESTNDVRDREGVTFDGESERTVSLLNDTEYDVYVHYPDGLNQEQTFTPDDSVGEGLELDIHDLGEGNELTVSVENAAGEPKAAGVEVFNEEERYFEHNDTEHGPATFTGMADSTEYHVRVDPWHPDLEMNRTVVDMDEEDKDITVQVAPGEPVTVEGEITAGGEPVNATIDFHRRDGSTESSVETEAGGEYIVNLPEGRYAVRIDPHDNDLEPARDARRISEPDEGSFVYDYEFPDTVSLSGTVTATGGEELEDVEVFAWSREQGHATEAVTDENGEYSMSIYADATYQLVVFSEDYMIVEDTVQISETDDRNYILEAGDTVSGQIQYMDENEELRNVSTGAIAIWNESEESFGWTEFEDGTYDIDGLRDIDEHTHNVYIRPDDRSLEEYRQTGVDVNASGSEFNLSLRDGQELHIRVESQGSGDALPNATVLTHHDRGVTDDDGTVNLGTHPVGDVEIQVRKDGYRGVVDSIEVEDPVMGEADDVLHVNGSDESPIALEQAAELEVDVNVTDNDEDPVSTAYVGAVSVEEDVSASGNTLTDSGGEGAITGLVSSDYRVVLALDEDTTFTADESLELSDGESGVIEGIDQSIYDVGYEVTQQ